MAGDKRLTRVRRTIARTKASFYLIAFAIFGSCIGSNTFAQLTMPGDLGDYAVGHDRISPDEDPTLSDNFYLWYPVRPEDTTGATNTRYLIYEWEFPSDHSFENVAIAPNESFPLVLFYHGSGAWGAMMPTLAETLASHGYVVAAMTGNPPASELIDLVASYGDQPQDVLFSSVDTNTVGTIGLSGGGSAALFNLDEERVKAAMPIAGARAKPDISKPVFVLGGTLDTVANDATVKTTFATRVGGDRYLAFIEGAGHLSFADWCTRNEYAIEHYGRAVLPSAGDACTPAHIPNEEAINLTNFYATAFFGRYLSGMESYEELLTATYAADHGLPMQIEAVAANARPGDANHDGEFTSADLVQVFQDGLYETRGIDGIATWRSGDWSADARFSSTDLVLAFQEGWYEQELPIDVNVVPEPTTAVMMMVGLIAIAIGRRRPKRCADGELLSDNDWSDGK